MKIFYLVTGSGGSFYCGNCYRDMLYLRAMKKVPGVDARAIPLYLPPDADSTGNGFEKTVFFGAISLYLREKVRLFKNMPSFMDKILDSGPLLSIAARQAGATRTEGMEELTLNMISGGTAFRARETDRLVKYLTQEGAPQVIHLSNALIVGLARHLKKRMDVRIVCSILNEDDWIDEMAEPYRSRAWKMIAAEASSVDLFITPSKYYRDLFISRTGIDVSLISVVPLGYDPEEGPSEKSNERAPAVGYFSRVSHLNGFDKLVDAFIMIKSSGQIQDLTLHVCGGFTGDDKPFVVSQIKKIKDNGFGNSVKIYPEFSGNKKHEFFGNVDIISVPVRKHDGYGLYILEANSAGVPVVQPATGAFPEILKMTGGGLTYFPDTTEELSATLVNAFKNADARKKMAEEGISGVKNELSLDRMAERLALAYNGLKI